MEHKKGNLFIPLKREYYNAFIYGIKGEEYRMYGKRWNEETCKVGREVTLSLGYGKNNRTLGVITGFRKIKVDPLTTTKAFLECYPRATTNDYVAAIKIDIKGCK